MSSALVLVDIQNDFCEGGSLAVAGGARVASDAAAWVESKRESYEAIVATQDWHIDPGAHWAEPGSEPNFVDSWPVHCEVGTSGADFHENLRPCLRHVDEIFRKGERAAAYSGFEGANQAGQSLASWLRERGITHLDVCGIATDYCVRATVLDALREAFSVTVVQSLTAGVAPASTQAAVAEMRDSGALLA